MNVRQGKGGKIRETDLPRPPRTTPIEAQTYRKIVCPFCGRDSLWVLRTPKSEDVTRKRHYQCRTCIRTNDDFITIDGAQRYGSLFTASEERPSEAFRRLREEPLRAEPDRA